LALQAKLYPSKAKAVLMPEPDFDRVLRELARPHVTRRQLWREYRAQHPNGLKYTAFCVHFRRWRKSLGSMRNHSRNAKAHAIACSEFILDNIFYQELSCANLQP
jgi:transposase